MNDEISKRFVYTTLPIMFKKNSKGIYRIAYTIRLKDRFTGITYWWPIEDTESITSIYKKRRLMTRKSARKLAKKMNYRLKSDKRLRNLIKERYCHE